MVPFIFMRQWYYGNSLNQGYHHNTAVQLVIKQEQKKIIYKIIHNYEIPKRKGKLHVSPQKQSYQRIWGF